MKALMTCKQVTSTRGSWSLVGRAARGAADYPNNSDFKPIYPHVWSPRLRDLDSCETKLELL